MKRNCKECEREFIDKTHKMCGSCRIKRTRHNTKAKAIALLGGKCTKCGYSKSKRALHFHHLDPAQKDIKISEANNPSWERLEQELKKCILVCANCHAEIHEEIDNQILSNVGGEVIAEDVQSVSEELRSSTEKPSR